MIYSWGFLQDPQTLSGDVKRETGLSTLATIIKRNIATWRMLDNGTPIYRIWYIQFLFFQEAHCCTWVFFWHARLQID